MPSMFIAVKNIKPEHQQRAISVRAVRVYEVPKVRGDGQTSKSMEVLLHNEEGDDNTLTCTLWNEHVSSILPYYNSDSKEPLIVVIQCCRAKVVRLRSENTPMRSLSTGTLHSNSMGISDFKNSSVIVTTCYDLNKIQEYYVAAEILGIDLDDDWYYISCMSPGCNKKLKEEGGSLLCTKCHKPYTLGTVRYKVVVMALDKSGDVPPLLWDREVSELVGIPASILYEKYKEVDVEVPPELEAIVGMKMMFKIGFKKALKRGMLEIGE
ncbi:PREDICTED: uncharacterized protein LOC109163590 [Ipomoea nil]|uniref:uncharacterized protein LOC109163590 n=1 Tax=Ipomoea nil TaxID=35883 RepID=UPI00090129C4|nr:PREDICTED: uncharacterized protein LOC109163590 [Ipomoea nil]